MDALFWIAIFRAQTCVTHGQRWATDESQMVFQENFSSMSFDWDDLLAWEMKTAWLEWTKAGLVAELVADNK